MEENKNKFEMPDVDELEKKLDEPVEKKYELPDELKQENDMINPVNKVGPNSICILTGLIFSGILLYFTTRKRRDFSYIQIINIIALLCGIGGIVFGVVGGNQNVSYGAPRGAIATAGIVCGVLGILLSGAAFAIVAACSGIKNFLGF